MRLGIKEPADVGQLRIVLDMDVADDEPERQVSDGDQRFVFRDFEFRGHGEGLRKRQCSDARIRMTSVPTADTSSDERSVMSPPVTVIRLASRRAGRHRPRPAS